jgi:hypothetical protein
MLVSPELQTQDSTTNGYGQTKDSGGNPKYTIHAAHTGADMQLR